LPRNWRYNLIFFIQAKNIRIIIIANDEVDVETRFQITAYAVVAVLEGESLHYFVVVTFKRLSRARQPMTNLEYHRL
jgi:hypothetical protein